MLATGDGGYTPRFSPGPVYSPSPLAMRPGSARSTGYKGKSSGSKSKGKSSGSKSRGRSNGTSTSKRRSSSNSGYKPPRPAGYSPARPAVGNTRTGNIAPAAPPRQPPMTLDQYLASDTSYKTQKSAYENALRDYAAQYSNEQNKYGQEYDATVAKLGVDRGNAQTALTDDYASRGMMTSGVYTDALNDFQSEWDTKASDLQRAKEAYMNDLLTGKTNFEKEQQLLLEQAKQQAANRYTDSRSVF